MKSLAIAAISLTVTVATSLAGEIDADREMARYVYPGNATAKVEIPVYMPGTDLPMTMSKDGRRIVTLDPRTWTEQETIMNLDATRENKLDAIDGFKVSPDGSKIMVWTGKQAIYRRSFKARYWIYDRHSRILRPLVEDNAAAMQRAPLFSPDARMVAFVSAEDNNIYVKKIDYNTVVAVTKDGAINKIINGVPDWTYEEEFATTVSMAWAPDNATLCFIKYNEADVPMFTFPLYEGACNPNEEYSLYPGSFDYKYPVAGVTNSHVSVHSYDIDTRKVKDIKLPDNRIEYIPRIDFAYAPDRLVVTTLNREQNRMELYCVNPRSTSSRSLLVEETATGWIEPEVYETLTFCPDFFVMMSSRSGYAQLYQYGYSGALERTLTSGNRDVTGYYGYNASERCHYFQSTGGNAVNRVVSCLDAKGGVKNFSPENGTADAWFSPSMSWMMLRYSNVSTPPVYTFNSVGRSVKKIRTLEDNAKAASYYASMPRREFFTIPASGSSPSLNGYVIKPVDNGSRLHPVVMYQYSGPGSQEVRDMWNVDWANYFAMKGYMVVCVDGRGTGGRGREFREAVYRNLGHYETIDQLAAARYAATLPGADPSRIGIFGWSYGGYETLMAASAKGNPYKAAVAVAPVTDWRYYDTVYAERYMLTPQQNAAGYRDSAPINAVGGLDTRLLIMHGTADDNVHLSNTMEYVSRLISAGKFCDMMLFPNMNHSINGCDTRLMVYSRMLDYFNRNL